MEYTDTRPEVVIKKLDLASTDDLGADAPGAGAVVRHLAAGPRLEGIGHGGGAGKGPSHHRTMGGGLR